MAHANSSKKCKIGSITVPKEALVQPHELNVATILSWSGEDVAFIPANNIHSMPDIEYANLEWEIKSPVGNSSYTLENNVRLALRQSNNIIIDLQRTKLLDEKCLRTLEHRAKKLGKKYKIMAITKTKKVVKFF